MATDFTNNVSPVSDPLTVTTTPVPNDTIAPSTPASFWGDMFGDGSGETLLQWSPATDDITPAAYMYYEVYMNGAFLFGVVGRTSETDYATLGMRNTFELYAIDEAGNRSAPAVFVLDLSQ